MHESRSSDKPSEKDPGLPEDNMLKQRPEIIGVVLILLALFGFITNYFPDSTGLIGYWLIETSITRMIGNGVFFFPFFLMGCGAICIFSTHAQKRNAALIGVTGLMVSLVLLLELSISGVQGTFDWPIPPSGGGYLGYLGLYLANKVVGISGIYLIIIGLSVVSVLVTFNIPLRSLLVALFSPKTVQDSVSESENSTDIPIAGPVDSFLKQLKHTLFYRTAYPPSERMGLLESIRVESGPEPVPEIEDDAPDTITIDAVETIEIEPPAATEPEDNDAPDSADSPSPAPTISTPSRSRRSTSASIEVLEDDTDDPYQTPPLDLFAAPHKIGKTTKAAKQEQEARAKLLEQALASFNVKASVVNITPGPTVTRYELQPGIGVKISKITNLSKDIALNLSAPDVRIEAPIPGKALIGIEVPNPDVQTVTLRSIVERTDFMDRASLLNVGLGLTITGESIIMDLAKMPHVLIAGATGSGKSVCVNSVILSILLRARPDEVKFLMIDPKKVELSLYEGIPHLIAPVVTNPHKAAATLKQWALLEMERRYDVFSRLGVKSIEGYNAKIDELNRLKAKSPKKVNQLLADAFDTELPSEDADIPVPKRLPFIVVVIDELADLMMVASQDVENTICRLAQMARATGIHLVIATQRPSVNVVTGLIKANVPSRISFFLQSQIDSRTILDQPGAEKLLGKGDMLYNPVGGFKPMRLQGVFISEKEVKQAVGFIKRQGGPNYDTEVMEVEALDSEDGDADGGSAGDDLFDQAKELVQSTQRASTSYLQRKLRIGYNRAARLMDELEEQGVISAYDGENKARQVL